MSTQKTYSSEQEIAEIWKLFRETDRKIEATAQQMKETDRRMQETDRQMKETDRRLKKLDYMFTGHWGKLMEALTKGGLVQALQKRNIPVTGLLPNAEKTYKDQRKEFDIVAINGEMVVVVEVKTTLKVQHIQSFLETMKSIKNYFPEYGDKRIYGATAYLKANESSDDYAEKEGLFILNPVGNVVRVMNRPAFQPKQLA